MVIFWDFDGTLTAPNKSFSTALHAALEQVGCPLSDGSDIHFLENVYTWKSPQEDHTTEIGEQWWDTLYEKVDIFCAEKGVNQAVFSQVHTFLREKLIHVDNYCLYSDTKETLARCMQLGYRNYLLTNNYPEIVENIVKLGIDGYFTKLFVSSHIGYDKPRKELYEFAIQQANANGVAYMIGDNPVADMAGGQAAGLTTIYVHNGILPTADFSVNELSQIPELLK